MKKKNISSSLFFLVFLLFFSFLWVQRVEAAGVCIYTTQDEQDEFKCSDGADLTVDDFRLDCDEVGDFIEPVVGFSFLSEYNTCGEWRVGSGEQDTRGGICVYATRTRPTYQ